MPKLQRYTAFLIAALFFAYVTLTRNLPVVAADILSQKFKLSEALFGQYRGIYYFGYCLSHLPVAYTLDRFGPRSVVAISLLLCLLGLSPMLFSESSPLLIIGRFVLGLGSATAILSVFKISRSFFAPHQFAIMVGIAATIGYISSVIGLGPLQRLIQIWGYDKTLYGILISGGFLSLGSLIFIAKTDNRKPKGFMESLKRLVCNKYFLRISLLSALMVWGLEGFADGWSNATLISLFGYDTTRATDLTSLIFIGFAIGSISLPFIVNLLNNSKQMLGLCGLGLTFCLAALFIPEAPYYGVLALCLLIGFFSAFQVLGIDWAGRVVEPEIATLAATVTNMVIMFFGYPFHTVATFMMNGKGTIDPVTQTLKYSHADLFIGLIPFMVCGIIAYLLNHFSDYDKHVVIQS